MCTSYHIQLRTRDGAPLAIDCQADESILSAATKANLSLPAQCRQGSCGACFAQVRDGRFAMGAHHPDALPKAGGGASSASILMCCTQPRSDLTLDLPYTQDKIIRGGIPERSGHIAALETIARDTVQLTVQLDDDPVLGRAALFEPGQYMELGIPGITGFRAYSLANTDNWDGLLVFLIRLQAGGQFSSYLRSQPAIGSALRVRGPQGSFGVDPRSLHARWLVAGGTGLAPMVSILRRMADFQDATPVRLIYGANTAADLMLQSTLDDLAMQLPQLQCARCLVQASPGGDAHAGTPVTLLQALLADHHATHTDWPDIYLCGPAPMIDAATQVALAAGVPALQIVSERFLAG